MEPSVHQVVGSGDGVCRVCELGVGDDLSGDDDCGLLLAGVLVGEVVLLVGVLGGTLSGGGDVSAAGHIPLDVECSVDGEGGSGEDADLLSCGQDEGDPGGDGEVAVDVDDGLSILDGLRHGDDVAVSGCGQGVVDVGVQRGLVILVDVGCVCDDVSGVLESGVGVPDVQGSVDRDLADDELSAVLDDQGDVGEVGAADVGVSGSLDGDSGGDGRVLEDVEVSEDVHVGDAVVERGLEGGVEVPVPGLLGGDVVDGVDLEGSRVQLVDGFDESGDVHGSVSVDGVERGSSGVCGCCTCLGGVDGSGDVQDGVGTDVDVDLSEGDCSDDIDRTGGDSDGGGRVGDGCDATLECHGVDRLPLGVSGDGLVGDGDGDLHVLDVAEGHAVGGRPGCSLVSDFDRFGTASAGDGLQVASLVGDDERIGVADRCDGLSVECGSGLDHEDRGSVTRCGVLVDTVEVHGSRVLDGTDQLAAHVDGTLVVDVTAEDVVGLAGCVAGDREGSG